MRRAMLPIVLGLLGFGLCVTSVALAASGQPAAAPFSGEAPLYGYDAVTPTNTVSHPVALAIANYFSDTFGVTYADIMSHHVEDGLGYGEIAKVYFIAETSGADPEEILALRLEDGMGWGEILKFYELHPGLAGRGGNLGMIMSSREQKKGPSWMPPGLEKKGLFWMPPGQAKKNATSFGPPSLKASDEDDDNDHGGGPPITPPGQLKKQNKSKGKGKK